MVLLNEMAESKIKWKKAFGINIESRKDGTNEGVVHK